MKHTTDRLLEKYNTYRRRPTAEDPRMREFMFKSFQRTLNPWLPSEKEAAILDIACGEGTLLLFLKESGYQSLHGFDYSPENVKICHHLGLNFVQEHDALDIRKLYPEKKFDLIFLMDFLEHIPKQQVAQFLEDVSKKLKSGSSIIIQTPNMGSLIGVFHRYNDLTHEFALTENTIFDLMLLAGFDLNNIEIRPAWNATTIRGRLREIYLRILHQLVFLAEDSNRPKIPTKNLLVRGIKR